MRWIILEDLTEDMDLDEATPENKLSDTWFVMAQMPPGFTKASVAELPYEFQLLDGDGEVYFRGKCGDLDNADGDQAFAPLDNYGEGFGCVEMQYRKAGATDWETL